jgi:N-dimethylarginine dimethylaminohydrolase
MYSIAAMREMLPTIKEKFEKVEETLGDFDLEEGAKILIDESIESYKKSFEYLERSLTLGENISQADVEKMNEIFSALSKADGTLLSAIEKSRERIGAL